MRWSGLGVDQFLSEEAYLKRVIIKVKEGRAKVKCGYCRGTAKDSWGGMSCFICHGTGVNEIQMPVARCAFCRGIGRPQPGEAITCAVCKGTGVLTRPDDPALFEWCDACSRSGRVKAAASVLTCTKCGGKGFIEKR